MKSNHTEFVTTLSVADCSSVFRRAVDKRPLKLKFVPFDYFTPGADGSDLVAGAVFHAGENDGAVVMRCFSRAGGTQVLLESVGNIRGRIATNSLVKHIVSAFELAG
jgi:hypothetical protein